MKTKGYLIIALCTLHITSAQALTIFGYEISWEALKNYFAKPSIQPTLDPQLEAAIGFDRDKMILIQQGLKGDGTWTEGKDLKEALPNANLQPWPTQNEFLSRLRALSTKANQARPKRLELCWLESKKTLNPTHYIYQDQKTGSAITWPESLFHYIQEHNVKPSKEFYVWVMHHPEAQLPQAPSAPLTQQNSLAVQPTSGRQRAVDRAIAIGRHIAPEARANM